MKKGFVATDNFRRLSDAQRAVEKRGAQEAGMVIIKGPFGVGKSAIVERWAVDNGAIFLRCKETWTKRSLIDEMAEQLGLDTTGRNSVVQARVIARLGVDMTSLVLDESDFLIRGGGTQTTVSLLECVRDITDITGIVCYLVGMEKFGDRLARHGHIASRVNRIVEFQPLSLADVTAACEKLAEISIAPEVIKAIHEQSHGKMRGVLNAISNLEQFAEGNDLAEVKSEHIRGRALCVEFKPGQRGGVQ